MALFKTLEKKYDELIQSARSSGVTDLQVREQDNVLYIDGQASSEAVKKNLWDVYGRLDPNYRSADVVMNIRVNGGASSEYVVKAGDNLTKIGKQYGIGWKEIYEANRDQIRDPDLIQPGWKLKIPGK
jgi:nucleoid-associated protein YgaU